MRKAAEPIYKLIKDADVIVLDIQKSMVKEDDVPAPDKQQKLLGISTKISGLIGNLVGKDRKIGSSRRNICLRAKSAPTRRFLSLSGISSRRTISPRLR